MCIDRMTIAARLIVSETAGLFSPQMLGESLRWPSEWVPAWLSIGVAAFREPDCTACGARTVGSAGGRGYVAGVHRRHRVRRTCSGAILVMA